MVTKNGQGLRNEEPLCSGDIIGLGQHYLFLFKDPLASMHKVTADYLHKNQNLLLLINLDFFLMCKSCFMFHVSCFFLENKGSDQ